MRKIFSGKGFGYIRDGVAYSFSWLVILVLIIALVTGRQDIGGSFLWKLLAFCAAASVEFTVFFTGLLMANKSFLTRLNGFAALFLPTEIAFLYWAGILSGAGSIVEWLIFVGIIVVLYLICILLDKTILRRQGQEYTSQLNRYKEMRKDENESGSEL